MTIQDSVNKYLQASIANNWEHMALTDFQGASYQYREGARKVAKLHLLYGQAGIKPGDKVALCGKNSSQWAIALIATLTYGAVAVPILHDFKPDNIQHLVSHSESRLLFVDTAIWENLDPESMAGLQGAIQLSDFSLLFSRSDSLSEARRTLNQLFGERYPERFTPADVKYHIPEPDALMLINYTSGSTGFSKGVMITQRNLWSNLQFCIDHLHFLNPGDGIVCMLPLAHMYGLVADFLHTFIKGCHIYFLTRTPSPKIIMDAFAMVRPKMIITVPLIIEKIIKTKVFPLLDKPMMKLLMHVPFVDDHLLGKIKERLEQTFGGQLQQMIIGGAGLSKDVETFLRRIGFP
ncbi:MAG: AMP-binding protein, partial [Muribaculaceae bacterium]|nr:AMP-binding protein [Muribaculaceae bacterium]